MIINKATINKMLEMSDDKLLTVLRIFLTSSGIDLGGKKLDEKTVRKLRSVLAEVNDGDIERATYLIDRYKRGG